MTLPALNDRAIFFGDPLRLKFAGDRNSPGLKVHEFKAGYSRLVGYQPTSLRQEALGVLPLTLRSMTLKANYATDNSTNLLSFEMNNYN